MDSKNEKKVVVTVAVTGAFGDRSVPFLPITPKEIAESALEACNAGASVAHIHVRDVQTGKPSMDFELYEEVVRRIRDNSEMLVNLSTGPGGRFIPSDEDPVGFGGGTILRKPEKRIEHVIKLKPEICSLDVGTINFGAHTFLNFAPHVEWMAEQIKEAGVRPELEVFEIGHINFGRYLIDKKKVAPPALFQFCMGVKWGIPATTENILSMKREIPSDAVWSAFGVGISLFPTVAQTILLGGNVRVGLEDCLYLQKSRRAKSNSELVKKAVEIILALGKEPAAPAEARKILNVGL
jgi:uncharacterized protein (DUF849 family)